MRLRLNHVAREAGRYGLSDRAAATICTALLFDLGLVTETDQTIVIDKSKVRRERNMFRNKVIGKFTQSDGGEQSDAIYFDGGKDQTLFQHDDIKGTNVFEEEYYVLVGQPRGEYLTHLTLQSGNAVAISEAILKFTGKYNINYELKVIGCDSTKVNTGNIRRVIHRIEEKIGHMVMWLICLLHTNELPLLRLFTNLDRKTCRKESF